MPLHVVTLADEPPFASGIGPGGAFGQIIPGTVGFLGLPAEPMWTATRVVITEDSAQYMVGATFRADSLVTPFLGPPPYTLIMDLYSDAGNGPGVLLSSGQIVLNTEGSMITFSNIFDASGRVSVTDTQTLGSLGRNSLNGIGRWMTAQGVFGQPLAVFDPPIPAEVGTSFWIVGHVLGDTPIPYIPSGSTPGQHSNSDWVFLGNFTQYSAPASQINGLIGPTFAQMAPFTQFGDTFAWDVQLVYSVPTVGTDIVVPVGFSRGVPPGSSVGTAGVIRVPVGVSPGGPFVRRGRASAQITG